MFKTITLGVVGVLCWILIGAGASLPLMAVTPPPGDCTPSVDPVLSVMTVPGQGFLWPDTVAGVGANVQLQGRAALVRTARNCGTSEAGQLANPRWNMTFQPLGGDDAPATGQLSSQTGLSTNFTAAALGTYRVTFQADPPSGQTVQPVTFRVEAVDTPIGWVNLGPDGTRPTPPTRTSTGRINALALDPQTSVLYAGAALGGVWKSTDGGQSWSPMSDNKNLSPLAIGALAADNGTIYAGTGEPYGQQAPAGGRANGVFVSTDAGLTWTRPVTCPPGETQPGGRVFRIVIDRTSTPPSVYMAGDVGVLRRHAATGCWIAISVPNVLITDIALDPTSPAALYAAVPGSGILRTTNAHTGAPATWNEYLDGRNDVFGSPPSGLIKLAVGSGGTLYAAFGRGGGVAGIQVWRKAVGAAASPVNLGSFRDQAGNVVRDNNGNPVQISCWTNPCPYDLAIAINPFNDNDLFLSTGITWRGAAADAGRTWNWTDISGPTGNNAGGSIHSDVHDMLLTGPLSSLALYDADDGGIFAARLSLPAGRQIAWTPLNDGLVGSQFYTLATAPARSGTLSGGLQDNASQYRWLGRQWQVIPGANGDGGWVAFGAADPSLIFYNPNAGYELAIRSTQSPNATVGLAYAFWADPLQPDALLGADPKGQLYISYDASGAGPATWSCIHPTPGSTGDPVYRIAVSRDPATRPAYWVGTANGKIFRVSGPGPVGPRACDSFLPTLIPVFDPAFYPQVFTKTSTITRIDDLVEDPFTPCVIYAVTDISDAALNQWQVIKLANTGNSCTSPLLVYPIAGLPGAGAPALPATSGDLRITADPSVPGILYVGTDRGLFIGQEGSNGQWSWRLARDFPATRVTSLQLQQNAQQVTGAVYTATFGRGVWQRVYTPPTPSQVQRAAQSPSGVIIQHCETHLLNEDVPGASRLAIVDVAYINTDPPSSITVRPSVTLQSHEQPYFAREEQPLATGTGSVQLLLNYAAANAPLSFKGDSVRLDLLDANGHVFQQAFCDLNATWLRSDATQLHVEGTLHQDEGGDVSTLTQLRVTIDSQSVETYTTPFDLTVAKGSKITLAPPLALTETEYSGWFVDEEPAGRDEFTLTMDDHHVVRAHFHALHHVSEQHDGEQVYLPVVLKQ